MIIIIMATSILILKILRMIFNNMHITMHVIIIDKIETTYYN